MGIQTDLQNWLVIIVGGGLLIKIVWEWLKNRGRAETFKPCPLHEHVEESIKTLDKCLIAMKTRYVDRDEFKQLGNEIGEKIDTLHDRITKTTTAFDRTIADIRVLVARIETIQNITDAGRENGQSDR